MWEVSDSLSYVGGGFQGILQIILIGGLGKQASTVQTLVVNLVSSPLSVVFPWATSEDQQSTATCRTSCSPTGCAYP